MIRKRQNGFTLIEIMVVVAIIGILASIAMPSYFKYIREGRRVEARNMLQSASQKLEQYFSANRTYAISNPDTWLETQGLNVAPAGSSGQKVFYQISFAEAPTARKYTLQAVPQNGQAKDSCGTFTINQNNVRKAGADRAEAAKCWGS